LNKKELTPEIIAKYDEFGKAIVNNHLSDLDRIPEVTG